MKKLLSILLALTIVGTAAVSAYAADVTESGSSASTTVSHTVDAAFTATIPAYIVPDEQGEQTSVYTVSIKDALLGTRVKLSASVEYSGTLNEENGASLPYTLLSSEGSEITSGDTILTVAAGDPDTSASVDFGAALTEDAKYSGLYLDTATFTFNAAEMYTAEEIEASDYLFGIGATKSEYVVAEFNSDYSEVTIFKNGTDSVTSIGSWVFNDCTSLTSVTIPSSVTSIGSSAFYGCSELTDITIPDSVTSIGLYAFAYCRSLTSVTMGSGVTSIGCSAFYCCSSLTNT